MPIQDPSTIGVVGAGQMGRGIAQVAAQCGFAVLLHDQDVKVLDLALRSIDAGLKHQVEKGKLEESVRTQVIGRVRVAVEPEALSSADFTIEAISEDRALKTRVFAALDRICRPDVILASNTSSLSITQIAASTRRADRIIGMHFMNPVPVMELVEIVAGQSTSRETIEDRKSTRLNSSHLVISYAV